MSAVEKLPDVIWAYRDHHCNAWFAPGGWDADQINDDVPKYAGGIGVEYIRKDSLTPAVIAELFAETLTDAERAWLSHQIVDDDRYTKELRAQGRSVISFFTKDSQLRRLLTQEGGGQATGKNQPETDSGDPVKGHRKPATPDLREIVQRVSSSDRTPQEIESTGFDLLPKEESDDDELMLRLRLRLAVASLEAITACANADLAKYGEWQCDWAQAMSDQQSTIALILEEADDE